MKILFFIAALLMLLSVESGCCADSLPQTTNSVQQAYQELLAVKYFAFGGVGYAGSTSPGETAFNAVLASTNALQLLQRHYQKVRTQPNVRSLRDSYVE
ncbi:MAG: hypothetical protein WDN00_03530 [Limisphaerales bacterium]